MCRGGNLGRGPGGAFHFPRGPEPMRVDLRILRMFNRILDPPGCFTSGRSRILVDSSQIALKRLDGCGSDVLISTAVDGPE